MTHTLMTHTPILMLPYFQDDFIIETDALGQAMGAFFFL